MHHEPTRNELKHKIWELLSDDHKDMTSYYFNELKRAHSCMVRISAMHTKDQKPHWVSA